MPVDIEKRNQRIAEALERARKDWPASAPPRPTTECMFSPWPASINEHGYSSMAKKQHGTRSAHRAAYIQHYGPLPDGLPELDHLCRVTWCCNPKHLEAVTAAENRRRSNCYSALNERKEVCPGCGGPYTYAKPGRSQNVRRRCKRCEFAGSVARGDTSGNGHLRTRTHCPRGHAYDQNNTMWTPDGHRECKACSRERSAERRKQRRSERVLVDGVWVHPNPPGGHGSTTAYTTGGCRCAVCSHENRERSVRYRASKSKAV